jgi:hypothetical protein
LVRRRNKLQLALEVTSTSPTFPRLPTSLHNTAAILSRSSFSTPVCSPGPFCLLRRRAAPLETRLIACSFASRRRWRSEDASLCPTTDDCTSVSSHSTSFEDRNCLLKGQEIEYGSCMLVGRDTRRVQASSIRSSRQSWSVLVTRVWTAGSW